VTGNLAGLVAGSTFPITIDCNLDQNFQGGTNSGTPQNGGTVSLNSALAGSTCQAYETGQPAPAPGFAWDVPVVQITGGANGGACNPLPGNALGCVQFTADPGATITATVTNNLTVLPGDVIEVTKTVTNKPGSYDAATLFDVTVDCGVNFTANLQLNDGETFPGPNVVSGRHAVRGVRRSAADARLRASASARRRSPSAVRCRPRVRPRRPGAAACQQFLMPPGAGSGGIPGVTVTVTNPLVATDGGVTITKSATGGGVVAGSQFALSIDCGAGGTTSGNVTSGNSVALNNVDAASTCWSTSPARSRPLQPVSATERRPSSSLAPRRQTAAVAPAGSIACQQFTMPPGGSITGTVTNPTTANPGDVVTISKTVTGDLAGYVGGSTFAITVNCNGSQVVANLANGGSQAGPQDVPAGTQCTASEAAPPAAAAGFAYGTPTITITGGETSPVVCNNAGPCNFVVGAGGSVTVAVSNPVSANAGQITAFSKTVVGATGGLLPGTLFHFTLTCGAIVVQFDLADLGNDVGPNNIPAGTVCTIVEDSPPNPLLGFFFQGSSFNVTGAVGTTCTVPTGFACRQFTVGAGASIQIAAVNTLAVVAAPATSIPTLGPPRAARTDGAAAGLRPRGGTALRAQPRMSR
jgi:hypothetical protein